MIKIENTPIPEFLKSDIVILAMEKLNEFYSSKSRTQKRYNWPFNFEIDQNLKKYLSKKFHRKCIIGKTKCKFP